MEDAMRYMGIEPFVMTQAILCYLGYIDGERPVNGRQRLRPSITKELGCQPRRVERPRV